MTSRATLSVVLALAAGCAGGSAARTSAPAAPAAADASARPASAEPARAANAPGAPAPKRELSPRAQRLFDEAVAAEAQGKRLKVPTDWETLERRWRAVTEAEAVPEAWFNLGVTLERQNRLDDAKAAYRKALQLEPDLAQAAVNLGLLSEPSDPGQALQAWADLMRRFPDDPVPRERLATLYQAAGQRDEAWKLAREALVRDPRAIGAYKIMMRVALDRGSLDLAQLLALKAKKLDDGDPEITAFNGDVLLAQHDEPGAVAEWKKAIAQRDDYLPARYALLSYALRKQHWEGVAEQARAILRTDPQAAAAQLALGVAYRYLGEPDKALAAYDQAEKLAPSKLPEVYLARGVALARSKEQCGPALEQLKRYVAAVGPAATEGPALKLERECEQVLLASRQAEEAAREMKAEAEREAARKAAKAQAPAPAAAPTAPAPATAPDRPGEATAATGGAQTTSPPR